MPCGYSNIEMAVIAMEETKSPTGRAVKYNVKSIDATAAGV